MARAFNGIELNDPPGRLGAPALDGARGFSKLIQFCV
jgi:hypothetical protein